MKSCASIPCLDIRDFAERHGHYRGMLGSIFESNRVCRYFCTAANRPSPQRLLNLLDWPTTTHHSRLGRFYRQSTGPTPHRCCPKGDRLGFSSRRAGRRFRGVSATSPRNEAVFSVRSGLIQLALALSVALYDAVTSIFSTGFYARRKGNGKQEGADRSGGELLHVVAPL